MKIPILDCFETYAVSLVISNLLVLGAQVQIRSDFSPVEQEHCKNKHKP